MSASQSVDLEFIPLVESYQKTLKNGIYSLPAWRSAFMGGCGEQAGKLACCVLVQGTKRAPHLMWKTGESEIATPKRVRIYRPKHSDTSLSREWRINMANKKKQQLHMKRAGVVGEFGKSLTQGAFPSHHNELFSL